MAGKIIPDDLITTINDFKSTSNGQMINIHGKEYATVAHRVAVLRRNLGAKLSITTEVVSITDNKVVVKATGSISGVVIATGHAEEDRKASRINSTSALENAETSAVGRMAAFLGVTNDNIASAEEVSLAIEQQDKKLQAAMKELKAVSHAGSYQQWLTNYKTFLADLKSKNPIGYQGFMEQFTTIKNQLKSKGVIQ